MCLHFGYRRASLDRELWQADRARRFVTLQKAYRGRSGLRRRSRANDHARKLRERPLCRMLVEAYRQRYPRTSNRWHDSRIAYLCHCALQTTIRALAEPVMVRDVRFSPVGPLDDFGPHCEPFDRAGWPCRVDD
jgi:hypothetical protein